MKKLLNFTIFGVHENTFSILPEDYKNEEILTEEKRCLPEYPIDALPEDQKNLLQIGRHGVISFENNVKKKIWLTL